MAHRVPAGSGRLARSEPLPRPQRDALPHLEVAGDLQPAAGHLVPADDPRRDGPGARHLGHPARTHPALAGGSRRGTGHALVSGGQYRLFYSANSANGRYAVGVANCNGPSGPCTDASTGPLLTSDAAVSGPGGPSGLHRRAGNHMAGLPRLVARASRVSRTAGCSSCARSPSPPPAPDRALSGSSGRGPAARSTSAVGSLPVISAIAMSVQSEYDGLVVRVKRRIKSQ